MSCQVFEDEHYYICHDGRELRHMRTEAKEQGGYTQTFRVYGCADCSGCEHKSRCLYRYDAEKDAEKNKVMKINEQWEELKEASNANIQSKKGILKRQIRSIQTGGYFGDIKENDPAGIRASTKPEFCGIVLFLSVRSQKLIFPDSPFYNTLDVQKRIDYLCIFDKIEG